MTSADSNDIATEEVARLRRDALKVSAWVLNVSMREGGPQVLPHEWNVAILNARTVVTLRSTDLSAIASLTQMSALAAWLFLSDHPEFSPEWKLWTGLPLELPEVDLAGRDPEVVSLAEEFNPEEWPEEDRVIPAAFADLANFLVGRLPDGYPLRAGLRGLHLAGTMLRIASRQARRDAS